MGGFDRIRQLRGIALDESVRRRGAKRFERPLLLINLRRSRSLLWGVVAINALTMLLIVATWDTLRAFLHDNLLLWGLVWHRWVWIAMDLLAIRVIGRQLAVPGTTARLSALELAVLLANMAMVVLLVLPLYPYYRTLSLYYVAMFAVVPLIRMDLGRSLLVLALPSVVLGVGVLWPDPRATGPLTSAINLAGMALLSLVGCHYLYAERVRDLLQRDIISRQQAELGKQALTDELTGLPNRRSLNASLDREWRRAVRTDSDLAAIMLDIDMFKAYNDAKGHAAGDACLRQVAACLAECLLRPGDMVARYGGEEFTVVLPGVDGAGALTVAERIRRAVAALGLPHDGSPHGRLTVSLGVAERLRTGHDTPQALLVRADAALYAAKASGRNAARLSEIAAATVAAAAG